MKNDEIKNLISEKTGVPAEMLTGETAEENLEKARALLSWYKENKEAAPDPREQFASWIREQTGQPEAETPEAALDVIAEAVRIDNGGYPNVNCGPGNVYLDNSDPRPPAEQFREWFYNKSSFDPFSSPGGWKPLVK